MVEHRRLLDPEGHNNLGLVVQLSVELSVSELIEVKKRKDRCQKRQIQIRLHVLTVVFSVSKDASRHT